MQDPNEGRHKEGKKKTWIILGVLGLLAFYVLGSAAYVILFPPVPEPLVPLAAPRTTAKKKQESIGVLEPADRDPLEGFDATTPWATPVRTPGDNHEFLYEWEGETTPEEAKITDRWADALPVGQGIELVAFATWHPQPEDEVDPEIEWTIPVTFRDATSLEILDDDQLDSMGVPAAYREMLPAKKYHTPKMRLLFRTTGIEYPHILWINGGDAFTQAEVTYDISSLEDAEPESAYEDGWLRFDLVLVAWHDLQMDLRVVTLAGEPEEKVLPREPGAQVVFGDGDLRAQYLGDYEGEFGTDADVYNFEPSTSIPEPEREVLKARLETRNPYANSHHKPFGPTAFPVQTVGEEEEEVEGLPEMGEVLVVEIGNVGEEDVTPEIALRTSSHDYLDEHLGVLLEDGKIARDWATPGRNELGVAWREREQLGDGPLRLVFVPQVVELEFTLPGLPDAPNQDVPENLMHLKIPRLTLPEDPSSAEGRLLSFIAAITQGAWDNNGMWADDSYPSDLPADRTFRNTTPQELLHWYMRNTRGSTLVYTEDQLHFDFNPERQKWMDVVLERLRTWFPFL